MSSRLRRFGVLGAVVATAAVITAGATVAVAATRNAPSGTESFIISVAGSHEAVIAHGAPFVGGGWDDASHNNFDVLHFGRGTLRINHPQNQSHFNFVVNPKTCYATFTITGKYTLGAGTGYLKGLHGHGTYLAAESGLLKRTKSGACDQNATPFQVGIIEASGPVRR